MTTSAPLPTDSVEFSALAAEQLSYHSRMAAVFAVAGQHLESAAESLLAWTILSSQWSDASATAARTAAELAGDGVARHSDADRSAAAGRARGLALDIEAHYVSVGLHDHAALYAHLAECVDDAASSLVPRRGAASN